MKINHVTAIALTLSVAALATAPLWADSTALPDECQAAAQFWGGSTSQPDELGVVAPLIGHSTTQPDMPQASAADLAPVTARLVADTEAIEPGKPFHVGLLLDIQPGCHVYWKNPGDSGMPTSVNFSLPSGLTAVGSLQWPRPMTFHQAGNIVGYGYTGSLLLDITVNPSDCLMTGSEVTLQANASWLSCTTDGFLFECMTCRPGEAKLQLTLPVEEHARPANTQLFADWNSRKNPLAPAFTLKDQDGTAVQLSDFAGKVVVLEWTNPNCPFVQYHYRSDVMTMPKLAATYAPKGVVWLAIDTTSNLTAAKDKEFRDANHVPYAILDDRQGDVGRAYQAKSTPDVFVIDADGNIVYQGAIDNAPLGKLPADGKLINYVQQALDQLLANEPISTPQTKSYGCSVKYAK
jgi:DsbC/DsbD-like thiol-disulfide interchange protein/alkyl hydroperoxide reductase subunit AhpC